MKYQIKRPNPLKTHPFLQKLQWIADPVEYMEKASLQHRDMFTAEVIGFGDTVVFVSHPQGIQTIFANDRKKLVAVGEANRILYPLVGNNSMFLLEGVKHKQRRQLLMPSFHGERMREYGHLIRNITETLFSQLQQNVTFSALTAMREISMQVILQAVFGFYEGERCQQFKHLLPVFLSELFQSPLASSILFFPFLQKDLGNLTPWGRFVRQREKIDKLLYEEIAERRQEINSDRIDILSLLISSRDETGNSMSDQELRDELITLMISGHETTGTAMAWSLYWILQTPEVFQRLIQELDSLGDSPDPMSIFRLPYLTAVCNETLRINPVAMLTLPRVVKEPVELLGNRLESGTTVVGCIYLTHHREDLYPESKLFQPERFLKREFSQYEFMPFGGGVRGCIGQAIAMFEMKIVLATVLSRYQFALADGKPERPQRQGFTLTPANGVKMLITGKHQRQNYSTAASTTFTT
ncbi:Cytochrome P450 [Trichormus variabilis ATCC 29413]|uniref:Cytochrome P450 n=2 Tax=Anabaena variabilis TaxID=264691 RepID=Q3MBN3_TRIV2|nr:MULTISPECIES: cytochrome P450 [Nostocaceae]ABA21603.1 Cytochrome P450 [Trichormus variabilis ATCC 29413]MBC1216122.1 cytochrome P450 [Trichormus variabilis ARAD]MBC1255158.1 cytochrome P450 [Trichormus variabilis V5]MBC1266200.1 cytochrome P450 [Trichormus variabilis FSR]MBC1301655.1 cytochrome P450 [Trichormus variabilis N2B]